VIEVARQLVVSLGANVALRVTSEYRLGDIRHNVADLSLARKFLGYNPRVDFGTGLARFLDWARSSEIAGTGYQKSLEELRSKGLMHG
jgi:dTDP-L-rhamnose 4-epimerase